MEWISITELNQLQQIINASHNKVQLVFKHSTRCNISSMALSRLNKGDLHKLVSCYFLDVLSYRTISTAIAEMFQVVHESPQVLIIWKGECVYNETHLAIELADLKEAIQQV
jgi:bacillithiol system protein YtxJ